MSGIFTSKGDAVNPTTEHKEHSSIANNESRSVDGPSLSNKNQQPAEVGENGALNSYEKGGLWSWKEVANLTHLPWGGKALNLARLSQWGFPVPSGVVLNRLPTLEDWQILMAWWNHLDRPSLAIRSSAADEDGDRLSFAGQQKSFLNQQDEFTILNAIHSCFELKDNAAVTAYSQHFHDQPRVRKMNVVIQHMVDARFSGVFFSTHPRDNDGQWVMEIVAGLGEDLVSSQVTPTQIRQDQPCGLTDWQETWTDEIVLWGMEARERFGFEVDMEWSIDLQGRIWILQARPITALPMGTRKKEQSPEFQESQDEGRVESIASPEADFAIEAIASANHTVDKTKEASALTPEKKDTDVQEFQRQETSGQEGSGRENQDQGCLNQENLNQQNSNQHKLSQKKLNQELNSMQAQEYVSQTMFTVGRQREIESKKDFHGNLNGPKSPKWTLLTEKKPLLGTYDPRKKNVFALKNEINPPAIPPVEENEVRKNLAIQTETTESPTAEAAKITIPSLSPRTLLAIEKVLRHSPKDCAWDGQTFAECSGPMSPLALSIWQEAFGPRGAFSKALQTLGYKGFSDHDIKTKVSVLEDVLGHAYINLTELLPLYFGDIPYSIIPLPRPHLKFSWQKINSKVLVHTPTSILNMLRVAWRLQTGRRDLLNQCEESLLHFQKSTRLPMDARAYTHWPEEELKVQLQSETHLWADDSLKWSLMLVIMAEACLQSLLALLRRIYGETQAEPTLHRWLSAGLHTVTRDMQTAFARASQQKRYVPEFIAQFGHRGPGEMDLENPRWAELVSSAFNSKIASPTDSDFPDRSPLQDINDEIEKAPRFYQSTLHQEWDLLVEILELREKWKMSLMIPYTHLRWMALELGNRWGIGEGIFLLKLNEIDTIVGNPPPGIQNLITQRQACRNEWRELSLPALLTRKDLERLLTPPDVQDNEGAEVPADGPINNRWFGVSLSTGVVFGEVRVVHSMHEAKTETWPKNVILVAPSTDPSWTPLFLRVGGIIVERGGLLSHCAIVARELGLPAVSQVTNCHQVLKDGDHVWLDADKGQIVRHQKP